MSAEAKPATQQVFVLLSYKQIRSMMHKARRLGTVALQPSDQGKFKPNMCFVIEGECKPTNSPKSFQMCSPTIRSVRSSVKEAV